MATSKTKTVSAYATSPEDVVIDVSGIDALMAAMKAAHDNLSAWPAAATEAEGQLAGTRRQYERGIDVVSAEDYSLQIATADRARRLADGASEAHRRACDAYERKLRSVDLLTAISGPLEAWAKPLGIGVLYGVTAPHARPDGAPEGALILATQNINATTDQSRGELSGNLSLTFFAPPLYRSPDPEEIRAALDGKGSLRVEVGGGNYSQATGEPVVDVYDVTVLSATPSVPMLHDIYPDNAAGTVGSLLSALAPAAFLGRGISPDGKPVNRWGDSVTVGGRVGLEIPSGRILGDTTNADGIRTIKAEVEIPYHYAGGSDGKRTAQPFLWGTDEDSARARLIGQATELGRITAVGAPHERPPKNPVMGAPARWTATIETVCRMHEDSTTES
ncbi:hypothetical protein PZ938_05490 [Luteipulveratus sp. YIM 133132]|uniref:hypothetical protein n=1 Tax=Luteipulveratus flavus TaxID=3031728 RepID=UPI0023B181B8|nr:hypothetical protein [Luteipulveratus sp. YIM 133132]MDE9365054.1 hypothetical protein [Luteipulveratus sp. YIM 133132]